MKPNRNRPGPIATPALNAPGFVGISSKGQTQ